MVNIREAPFEAAATPSKSRFSIVNICALCGRGAPSDKQGLRLRGHDEGWKSYQFQETIFHLRIRIKIIGYTAISGVP